MKLLDLKFWQKGLLVTKSLCLTVLTLFVYTTEVRAQDIEQKAYYSLIAHIVAQDTVVKDYMYKALADKIKRGKITSKDSLKYVKSIKERKLSLSKYILNASFKRELRRNLDSSKEGESTWLMSSLERDKVNLKDIIKKVPSDSLHNPTLVHKGVQLIEDPEFSEPLHYFSSPIEIGENRFLVYYLYYAGHLNSHNSFIFYNIDENGNFKDLSSIPISIS
ncbi:hypothetical protein [Flagellimonas sp.]|uniref:hypothetical protein n=1 Tax=Flagellimonas sp. TaxID=2058762 RepID=UPI003B506159